MSDDLIARLRKPHFGGDAHWLIGEQRKLIVEAADALAAERARADAAERDAERYDYILRNPWRAIDIIRKSVDVNHPADWHTQLNAAIDAARKENLHD